MKQTKHTHTIACKEIFTHICENLDSRLDDEQCREIRKHIEECGNCTAYLDSLKKTVYLYKQYPTPKASVHAVRTLMSVIHLKMSPKKSVKLHRKSGDSR